MTVPVTGHTHRMEMASAEHASDGASVHLTVDGQPVELVDVGGTLLDALRGPLDRRSVKDGCSPQGQCGCCTVLVDGQPRVSCVTPLRRVSGRSVTTLEGLSDGDVQRWSEAFCATGGSQCGFCTPGMVMSAIGIVERNPDSLDEKTVRHELEGNFCRCTGYHNIVKAILAAHEEMTA